MEMGGGVPGDLVGWGRSLQLAGQSELPSIHWQAEKSSPACPLIAV